MTKFPWLIYSWSDKKEWWVPMVGPDAEDLCFSSAEEAKTFAQEHCKDYVTWVGMAEKEEE